ncbi:MmcQ/YjbR family DNA-binding protein [Streptomyces sp. BE303]|uniref:MmcQ/YjbR family DNA-binding protein n=1 Tax=Streptomycetaceae TaxID=2062 RepID=UPI002E7A9350|nr:MmcQ/YjbR family DNA-binding protein [Streptomyces sp. BE303]MED7953446.1 MmcQ/YjbR family DNA-binding protein [Streptomyces sp. BE303]
MTPQELSDFALELPGTTDDEAFGPGATVFKVEGKVFAILQDETSDQTAQVTLKCEPDLALHLRDQYPAVGPGYHVNKRHWNTVVLDSTVPVPEVREMVEHSWDRVVAGMPKAARDRLRLQRG